MSDSRKTPGRLPALLLGLFLLAALSLGLFLTPQQQADVPIGAVPGDPPVEDMAEDMAEETAEETTSDTTEDAVVPPEVVVIDPAPIIEETADPDQLDEPEIVLEEMSEEELAEWIDSLPATAAGDDSAGDFMSQPPMGQPITNSADLPSGNETAAPTFSRDIPALQPTAPDTEEYRVQRVFFGTDRAVEPDDERGPTFEARRSNALTLGRIDVTIPKQGRQVGTVPRPKNLNLVVFTLQIEREDPAKHLTIHSRQTLTLAEFQALAGAETEGATNYPGAALVFIHGFNVGFDEAMFRAAQMAHDLAFDGPAFAYSWPSQNKTLSYVTDTDAADRAAPFMDEFLTHVLSVPGVEKLHVVAHSMGNRALAELMTRAGTKLSQRGKAIDQLILAAPDIDVDYFKSVASHFTRHAQNVTLYACATDRALKLSRGIRDDFARAGDVPGAGPVVVDGIFTVDVTEPGTSLFSLNHNAYAESSTVLNDLSLILLDGIHPPGKRLPTLEKIDRPTGTYWRMRR